MSEADATRARALELIGSRVDDPSANGLARAVGALVSSGALHPGDQLPTVRTIAGELGVSTSTVSAAWRTLADHGIIHTDRRRGSTVRSSRAAIEGRYWQVPSPPGAIPIDLSTGTPDPALLPDVGVVLRKIHTDLAVGSYLDAPVLPDLETELRRRWPFDPAAMTVVDGALDALDRTVDTLVQLGDRVIVEDPTFPPLLDMLDLAGAEVIGVGLDHDGMRLDEFERAIATEPTAIFCQPRSQNPSGASLSPQRVTALASVLASTRTWVVEDDHSADASGRPLNSLAAALPHQSLLIQSYSKSHGPDLRIAAIGGAEEPIRRIERRRALGPSWTSRMIQQILLEMLTDTTVDKQVNGAGAVYTARRETFANELADAGIRLAVGSGLNIAVPVESEQSALVYLAAAGIGVAPGTPFMVDRTRPPFVRVSIGGCSGDLAAIAGHVAAAAHAR